MTEKNESTKPIRQRVEMVVGAYVQKGQDIYQISRLLDFDSIVGINVQTGVNESLLIKDVTSVKSDEIRNYQDLDEITDEDWRIARIRYDAIEPLLKPDCYGASTVHKRAKECDVNPATIYRWLNLYKSYGELSALIPKKRGWTAKKSRISKEVENVIEEVIENFYLTKQRSSVQKAITEVQRLCYLRKIKSPNANTIRSRIDGVSEKLALRGRGQREKAKNKYQPVAGKFPNADYPLAVIQIDHTPADIIVVDDQHRKPIGRPWITLAMDVHTRMVTGYYLSLDPPSETSVAMCVAQSILPKEEWLLLHDVDADWPVWGMPKTIHVDNGADFRSNNFQKSCAMYGIHQEFRPVKQPQYGGHIERVLGTFVKEIHGLPGTTFSNVKEKDSYASEKEAVMTMSELEHWLVSFICKVYHKKMHSGIGMTPTRKWEIGIFGNETVDGVGIPPKPVDGQTILLDFLPSFKRTVQKFGVTIEGLTYYAEALRPWVNASDPDNPSKKHELIFRRDPRDISTIWFFDPKLKEYYKIPTADLSFPATSAWEFKQAKQLLRREGKASVNEHQIFQAITEMRSKVEESKEKTKKARRTAQRQVEHKKKVSPANPLPMKEETEPTVSELNTGFVDGDIDDFGDIA